MIYHRDINAVQQHIRDAQSIREGLLLDPVNGGCILLLVFCRYDLLAQFIQPTSQKAPCATRKVCDLFAELWFNGLCHEISHSARRIEFTRGAGALEFP